VKGTPMNDKCQAFFDKLGVVSQKMEAIGEKMNQVTDETERQQYFADMMTLNTEAGTIIFDFVKENMKNKVGEFYFIHFSQAFTEDQIKQLLAEATPEYKAKVEGMMAIGGAADMPQSFIGQNYINVSGLTPDGKNISLSDYIGKNKVVLIDFWASWCGPCRQEMPNVVDAYNKFKSKGFEIVGISLDETKGDWEKGIKDLKITWPQMSDLKGWKSELSGAYHVSSIPFTLLVDENGKVIAENLRGKELHNKLQELLK
ncbi:TlpA family protein disulfide reductase, partial [Dysgonomonas sp. OttesenSCG-928-M03]|nr:TlpA family protein disulfide reductase [Dysgonomonas sp. OttesenSCG-928-M03]